MEEEKNPPEDEAVKKNLPTVIPAAGSLVETDLTPEQKAGIKDLHASALADNTKLAYRGDWDDFTSWCATHGRVPLPASPVSIEAYLSDLVKKGKKFSTIERRLSGIAQFHKAAGFDPPPTRDFKVRKTMEGIRRKVGTEQKRMKPLLLEHLQLIIRAIDASPIFGTLAATRVKVILLLGFAAGFRESELAHRVDADFQLVPGKGLLVRFKGKTNQDAARWVAVPENQGAPDLCPMTAFKLWIERRGKVGADARTFGVKPRAIIRMVKRWVKAIGLDPKLYAGHSLRAGFVTEARRRKIADHKIMKQTGHKRVDMLNRYDRPEDLFEDNATSEIWKK